MTRTRSRLLLSLFVAATMQACTKADQDADQTSYAQISLRSNQRYEFDLGAFSAVESATISRQPRNYDSSYIRRDGVMAMYIYKPAADFTGTDEVQLRIERASNNAASSAPEVSYKSIRFTVSK